MTDAVNFFSQVVNVVNSAAQHCFSRFIWLKEQSYITMKNKKPLNSFQLRTKYRNSARLLPLFTALTIEVKNDLKYEMTQFLRRKRSTETK
ncbi:hypothetical protein METBIDRAFT_31249 [Metschnikowia bicuspidata var. bicuspidata NRRL YB-4993]|uniref:Uncharacterized protein n=1 Tax=Metschnikowia bicuspidata var. bicuspidata NRRL YB-4993 TaxID=869754 RepID=A0A1A0HEL5_9ASCO|nr:hypothetical protein METBIDRAFT_31249 [Metschnikowia bicuspidata var. bicuspidata NRRL YB-4993]OBA22332.1 hypothetical protein METBIDRAFT_31249 [Metschnikowia bicuspidata var. bicuspidata NRRL YB-4993]